MNVLGCGVLCALITSEVSAQTDGSSSGRPVRFADAAPLGVRSRLMVAGVTVAVS